MKKVRKQSSRLRTLEFRRADFSLFRKLRDGSTWEAALKGKGSQKIWRVLRTASSKCRNCPSGRQADVPGDCFDSAGNSWHKLQCKKEVKAEQAVEDEFRNIGWPCRKKCQKSQRWTGNQSLRGHQRQKEELLASIALLVVKGWMRKMWACGMVGLVTAKMRLSYSMPHSSLTKLLCLVKKNYQQWMRIVSGFTCKNLTHTSPWE